MLTFLVALVVVGMLLYLVELAPMDGTVKAIAKVLVIGVLLIWALKVVFSLAPLAPFR